MINKVADDPFRHKLLSHRARTKGFQENTLESFAEVLRSGVGSIEVDIRFSDDNVGYIFHDSFLVSPEGKKRFSERKGVEIDSHVYPENNTTISKLEDILLHFAEFRAEPQKLILDVKDFGFEEYIYAKLDEHNILEHTLVFSWTPQILIAFDTIFKKRGKSFPLFFSHVRIDSLFKYLFLPTFLNSKNFFVRFQDLVFVGGANYKNPLQKYGKGYRHVPYFRRVPEDVKRVLLESGGGICVSKNVHGFGDWLLKRYKREGLKIAIFGPFFGVLKIDTKRKFEKNARKDFIDMVFIDDVSVFFEKA